jgi:hypothetical protein
MEAQLTFEEKDEKFLIIKGDLTNLPCQKKVRLKITRTGVDTANKTRPLYGLPVYSKEFTNLDDSCITPKPKTDGCGCAAVW